LKIERDFATMLRATSGACPLALARLISSDLLVASDRTAMRELPGKWWNTSGPSFPLRTIEFSCKGYKNVVTYLQRVGQMTADQVAKAPACESFIAPAATDILQQ
jgi:hypothetical protein